jgi:N6-adenosine-specific RNA methylase IME4
MTTPHLPALVGLTLTPTSLELPEGLSFEHWLDIGADIRQVASGAMWWLGDWWAYGQHHYGDRLAAVRDGMLPWSFQTCANAGSIARAFGTSRRREVLSWSHHAEVAALEPAEADRLLGEADDRGWSRDDLRHELRRLRRDHRLLAVSEMAALGTFPILLADPPWRYEHTRTYSRAVENHYPTMELDEICALEVPATEDAVLFMWAPAPKVAEALEVVEAWGFTYRTHAVWVKDKIGMGNWFRQRSEDLFVAVRGDFPPPHPERLSDSVIEAPRTEHSAKPAVVYDLIDAMYPALPKVELFCRGEPWPGWVAWGNQ